MINIPGINLRNISDDFLNANNIENNIKILLKISKYNYNCLFNPFFYSFLKISDKSQRDLFLSISDKGIMKLLNLIKDENLELRKLSVKVIIELLDNNETLQNILCEKFKFNPVGNVVCLNWYPKELRDVQKIDEKVLRDIKNSTYNNTRKIKFWMWPTSDNYNDELFPDPLRFLLGIYITNKNVKKLI